jgi:hypothetical protein
MLRIEGMYFRFFIEASYWLGWSVVKFEQGRTFPSEKWKEGPLRCENFEDVDIPTDTLCVKESLGHEAWNWKE